MVKNLLNRAEWSQAPGVGRQNATDGLEVWGCRLITIVLTLVKGLSGRIKQRILGKLRTGIQPRNAPKLALERVFRVFKHALLRIPTQIGQGSGARLNFLSKVECRHRLR
jgi:hypothetical protein